MIARGALVVLMALLDAAPLHGAEAVPAAEDPALETRVLRLADELRCLVCQNQTLADSHAGLAIDLRNQIREQMRQGISDEQIRAYMVQRYGDFVLYRPPLKASTWVLWFGPFLLVIAGMAVLGRVLALRQEPGATEELSAEQAQRATALLNEGERR